MAENPMCEAQCRVEVMRDGRMVITIGGGSLVLPLEKASELGHCILDVAYRAQQLFEERRRKEGEEQHE